MNQNRPAPTRRAILAGGGALVLAGCSDLIGPSSTPLQQYLLTPTDGASTAGPKVSWSLAVSTSTVSDHLASARIALTQPDESVDYYAGSSWTDHLPVLVQNAIVEAFERSGRIAAVSADGEGFHADYLLGAQIRDFEARYSQRDGIPTAWVRIECKLASARGRQILASFNSVHEVAATDNSVPAAVQAFGAALGASLSEIVNWTLATAPPLADG
ncbi:MAG TPA: ABC-type transport auxiliary lipoprotein family protein [Rhizomicrobium sp.]|jgi:cholesterol transport system auxiliary component|nr:ABC-type transport auxiliary lipoprotein family protein [Rhizomicrobium sp.]